MQTNAPFVRECIFELPMWTRAGQDLDIGVGGPGIQVIGQPLMFKFANIISAIFVKPVDEQTETIAGLRGSCYQIGESLLDVAGAEEEVVNRFVGIGLGEASVGFWEDIGYEFRALDKGFEENGTVKPFQRVLQPLPGQPEEKMGKDELFCTGSLLQLRLGSFVTYEKFHNGRLAGACFP
jgi:hypothetical protein